MTRSTRRGLTLAETVISMAIVSTTLVAALSAVGAARKTENRFANRATGQQLARSLMSEILAQAYEEPVSAPLVGIEAGESAASRSAYDDVDDYHGWNASPPQTKSGAAWAKLSGWSESATVEWVNPNDLGQTAAYDTGVRRIRVEIDRDGLPMAALEALRTRAWQSLVAD